MDAAQRLAAVVVTASSILLCMTLRAEALDTTEPYGARVVDAEYYLGYGGVGLAPVERELSHEFILGYGVGERGSVYVGSNLTSDQQDFATDMDLLTGIMVTVLDGSHLDLDLMLDLGAPSHDLKALRWAPSIELNYDENPDMGNWGVYLRAGIEGRRERGEFERDARSWHERTDFGVNPGAYLRLSERHELLIEYDQTIALGEGRAADENGSGLGLGFNVLLSDTVELISQIHRDFPRSGNRARYGLSVGFIATLPTGP